MNVAVAYVYPAIQAQKYLPLARRFVESWGQFPPGRTQPALHVYVNGKLPDQFEDALFHALQPKLHARDNTGWDIGAFQEAADTVPCDLLVCLGACVHFHRAGWLDRIVESFLQYGIGLYGTACYYTPDYHVRTTCFWCPPEVLASYPDQIGTTRSSRYDFEHGPHSLTRFARNAALPCVMATWQGFFDFPAWRDNVPDRETILVRDQHIG